MELFLIISIGLTVATFLLIAVSKPAAPSLADHDSDYASDYHPEESAAELQSLDEMAAAAADLSISQNQTQEAVNLLV